jgi:hypothetical protein
MIDKYIEFNNSLNESKAEPKFEVGDTVVINDKLLKVIDDYDWSSSMKYFVGETFMIVKVVYEKHERRYRYYMNRNGVLYYVYDNCIDLIKPIELTKVRWYKKGKLEND